MSANQTELDLIDRFRDVILEYCDAPEVFIEAGGYYLVSAILGQYYKSPEMPHGEPNLWIVISSIPGRCRRSNVSKYVMKIYTKVMAKIVEEQLKTRNERIMKQNKKLPPDQQKELFKITPQLVRKFVGSTMIESGSPEGIMDHLTKAKKGEHYTLVSTEFGGVLVNLGGGGYEKGVGILFSKLAYGEGGKVLLSQRGNSKGKREVPEGLYVTMFAGMQEPELYLTNKQIRQGLLRRMVIIYVAKNDRFLPPLMFGREEIYQRLQEIADQYLTRIEEIKKKLKQNRQEKIQVMFYPDVKEELNRYCEELTGELDKNKNNYNIYRQGFWEHLAKFAMCKAIINSEIKFHDNLGWYIYVTMKHLDEAKIMFEKAAHGCMDAINSLGVERKNAYTHEEMLDNMYNLVYNQPNHKISGKTKLRRESKLLQKDFDEIYNTLLSTHRLREKQEIPPRGRPRRIIECVIDSDEEDKKGWKEF